MKRFITIGITIATAIVLCILPVQSFAAKAPYDNFSGQYIDDNKWDAQEFVREVSSQQLVSKVGSMSTVRNNTPFYNPSTITIIQAQVTVVSAQLGTGSMPSSFARVNGIFYDTGGSAGPTGDIYAGLYIGDRGSGLEAYWEVEELLDDNFTSSDPKGGSTLIGPGTLQYNQVYTVKLSYNGTTGFTFTVNGVSQNFTGPAKTASEVYHYRSLSSGVDTEGGYGFVHVNYDNVYINDPLTLFETFNTAPLDHSKWRDPEVVREIATGRLRMNAQGFDKQTQVSIGAKKYDTPFIETKVRIDSSSQLSPGANGIARIQGHFYNDSRGPGSGQGYNGEQGNVFVQLRLQMNDDRSLRAIVYVDRVNDTNFNDWTNLFGQDFPTAIDYDKDNTISIEFSGSALIFKCNSDMLTYNITTPVYPPNNEHRVLRSRVYLDQGESGYMKVDFDDVYVYKDGMLSPAVPSLLLEEKR